MSSVLRPARYSTKQKKVEGKIDRRQLDGREVIEIISIKFKFATHIWDLFGYHPSPFPRFPYLISNFSTLPQPIMSVAAQLLFHPKVNQTLAVLATSLGREKVCHFLLFGDPSLNPGREAVSIPLEIVCVVLCQKRTVHHCG